MANGSHSLLLLINGPMNSGKTTLTEALRYIVQANNTSFAQWKVSDELKRVTHDFFGMTDALVAEFEECKDKPLLEFEGMTPREAYIWMSEQVVKPRFGKDWLARRLLKDVPTKVVETIRVFECNFKEEAAAIVRALPCRPVVVQVNAPHATFLNDSRSYYDVDNVPSVTFTNNFFITQANQPASIRKLVEQATAMFHGLCKQYFPLPFQGIDYDAITARLIAEKLR